MASTIIVAIGSNNGVLPVRRQTITWNNIDPLRIASLGTNYTENKKHSVSADLRRASVEEREMSEISWRFHENPLTLFSLCR